MLDNLPSKELAEADPHVHRGIAMDVAKRHRYVDRNESWQKTAPLHMKARPEADEWKRMKINKRQVPIVPDPKTVMDLAIEDPA